MIRTDFPKYHQLLDNMSKELKKNEKGNLVERVSLLVNAAKQYLARNINDTVVRTYFEIGRMIVKDEQDGSERAAYAKKIIVHLSEELSKIHKKGYSVRNLEQMRKFYLTYSIPQTLSAELQIPNFQLSWSHYLVLIRIADEKERQFYEIEAAVNNWSIRELKRQFDAALYERLALSRDKEGVRKLSKEGLILEKPSDSIKDPLIMEFLGLEEIPKYSENDLENAIIDKLQEFLLELGKGFMFVARQKRISFDERHFRIDLVFYNRILRCFVLIDLKIGDLKHQDIGQMQMYVNYYDRKMKLEEENPTVGIILCKDKSDALVEFTLPKNNEQIFASRYQTVLPSKDELRALMEVE